MVLGAFGTLACHGEPLARRGGACAIALAVPDPLEAVPTAERCRVLETAWRQLAQVPPGADAFVPGDTAAIASAMLFTQRVLRNLDGAWTAQTWYRVELDVPGRPRLFWTVVDSATGAVDRGVVHR